MKTFFRLIFSIFLIATEMFGQSSLFSIIGSYKRSFEFSPDLRLTNHYNTQNLWGGSVVLEDQNAQLTWGGGLGFRYKCVDSYLEDIVDEDDSATGETVELKDEITFIGLFATGSVALANLQNFRVDLGINVGLIAADRKFALGDGALNLQAPIEIMPWLRLRLFPSSIFSPTLRIAYACAHPYTETHITHYINNQRITYKYKEKTSLVGPILEAGFIYRF
ncbi:MAG: hypothetical protein PHS99_08150 [Candidatus Marinimicrobia bacterium]|nr:hypothetical protein [Candidatus Neomarinimicrobiota bacterium]